mgnify:FL=1|tara:strand:- start:14 stop:238 length:225 start_codon:yes stop_codon:yes gene_type:complete
MSWEDIVKQDDSYYGNERRFRNVIKRKLENLEDEIMVVFLDHKGNPDLDVDEFVELTIKRIDSLTEDIIHDPTK